MGGIEDGGWDGGRGDHTGAFGGPGGACPSADLQVWGAHLVVYGQLKAREAPRPCVTPRPRGCTPWLPPAPWSRLLREPRRGLWGCGPFQLRLSLQSGQFNEDMIPTVGFNMRKIAKGNVTIKVGAGPGSCSHDPAHARARGVCGVSVHACVCVCANVCVVCAPVCGVCACACLCMCAPVCGVVCAPVWRVCLFVHVHTCVWCAHPCVCMRGCVHVYVHACAVCVRVGGVYPCV